MRNRLKPDPRVHTLLDMLSYCRPAGGATDRAFRARYLLTLPNAEEDTYGNIHVTVDDAPILWSAHTDTVHWAEGRQSVSLSRTGIARLQYGSKSSCLGADDTAGVFILREMILRRVPGHYVFHYAEERGGIGSSAIARHAPTFLSQFQCAIAVDRRGTADVITHQSGGRCCSDAFAVSLAARLNVSGLTYAPCAHGIYTDTAEYTADIPECTNLSVGYAHEHSSQESLDVRHVLRLLDALTGVRFEQLTIARDPMDSDQWEGEQLAWEDEDEDEDEDADIYLSSEMAKLMRYFERKYGA